MTALKDWPGVTTSFHNHTTWSDGVATPVQVRDAARDAGLGEVGISDHYVVYPTDAEIEWAMPPTALPDYVADLRDAASQPGAVELRVGIEVDYFPETIEATRARLAEHEFDYVIGSVHYLEGFPLDGHRRFWDTLTQDEVDDKWRGYWRRVAAMAESRVFDFAAHLDLPKKFGYRPSQEFRLEVSLALDAIKASDMAIEINTAGWSLPADEAYPAPWILGLARDREIPLLINADAHTPKYLVRNFDRARALAREVGYVTRVRYVQRERLTEPL